MYEPELQSIITLLQSCVNNVPLIVLGSGASIPYGLPSMYKLGEYLKSEIVPTSEEDETQWQTFLKRLDEDNNLEEALSSFHMNSRLLNSIIHRTWTLVNGADWAAYKTILQNGFSFPLYRLLRHLLGTASRQVSVVTTNYDRLAEYSASLANAFISTGYTNNLIGRFTSNTLQNNFSKAYGYSGQVNIWKVHGSLDWFRFNDSEDYYLPMQTEIPIDCVPRIVTPGLSKFAETHIEPFRTILSKSDDDIEHARGFLCIGYGFNDMHVHPRLLSEIRKNKPIIVITKELSNKCKEEIIGKSTNYFLFEEYDSSHTRIYTSYQPAPIICTNKQYWTLEGFLSLIINYQ